MTFVLLEHEVRRPNNGQACEVDAIKAKAAIVNAKRFIVKLQSKVKKQKGRIHIGRQSAILSQWRRVPASHLWGWLRTPLIVPRRISY